MYHSRIERLPCHLLLSLYFGLLTESVMETFNVILTFVSVGEILTSLVLILNGIICFSVFYEMKFGIFP